MEHPENQKVSNQVSAGSREQSLFRKINKLSLIKLAVSCVLAVLLNILLTNFVMNFLKFPLFLDTVFTAAITFSFGLIPGIIVAVFSWLLPCIYYKSINFFVLCSIAEVLLICALKPAVLNIPAFTSKEKIIAIYTGIAAKLMLLYILCAVSISILGGLINFLPHLFRETDVYYYGVADTFKPGLIASNLPILAVNILSRIPINLVDRFIVIFGGFFVSRGLVKIISISQSPK
ncbi:MAG: hypothetical protein FWD13_07020 [Treponema sp.]|nr:hypothetical protein [Treponema sp.]